MSFDQIVNGSWYGNQYALLLFRPELAVVGTILALLFVRLFGVDRWLPGKLIAMLGATAALALATHQYVRYDLYDAYPETRMEQAHDNIPRWQAALDASKLKTGAEAQAETARLQRSLTRAQGEAQAWQYIVQHEGKSFFSGLLTFDSLTVFFRIFLLMFLMFVVYLTTISGIPDEEDSPDFFVLMFGATLGMLLMASANHLLMVFLAIEMSSVPSYAMVGFLKGRRKSSEAALKYVVYGAGAAGVMLYGISLLAGLLGTAHFPPMVPAIMEFGRVHTDLGTDAALRTLVMAVIMIFVGIAFKLSIFPFHFWAPDAFEGAAAEVGGFLSVASKAAAFAVLLRICLVLLGAALPPALASLFLYMGVGLGLVAAGSATFGNLAAYSQTNIKRMLAYSTIAHAGYMLMSVSALLVILTGPGGNRDQAAACVAALLYYLVAYFFMNLGAFAVVALVRNQSFSEQISDLSGLVKRSPTLAVALAVCLCSLIGLPPFGGFMGKILVFYNVVTAANQHPVMWFVVVVGVMNTVFSLFYYMRVLKVMFIDAPIEGSREINATLFSDSGRYALLTSLPVLALGILVDPVLRFTQDIAKQLF